MRHPCPIARLAGVALRLAAVALVAAIALAGPWQAARAQPAEPLPVIENRGGASRLHPEPGALAPAPAVSHRAPEPEPAGPLEHHVGAYARYATIPDAVLGAFYVDHPSVHGVAAGLSYFIGRRNDYQLSVELDWMRLAFPDANWRLAGTPTFGASYAEIDLHVLSLDVAWRGLVPFGSGRVSWQYGAGLGLAVLVGPARTAEVLPTCEAPVSRCPHWREVTHRDADVPRVLPVLHLLTGLNVQVSDDAFLRLDLGVRNVPYVGLGAAVRL